MKKKIAVFFGGCSPEYTVSLSSAYAVLQNLDIKKYDALPIGISKEGNWYYYTGPLENILHDTWLDSTYCIPTTLCMDRSTHKLYLFKTSGVVSLPIDLAFPILHGKNGEDGTIQGALTMAGIPFVGCGVLSSSLCMDKVRAHELVASQGISVARSFVMNPDTPLQQAEAFAQKVHYPLYVKPVKAGSSFGITKVLCSDNLYSAIHGAFVYDDQVVLEENIDGFEVGCAILGNHDLFTGQIDEIELSDGFFNYTEKYTLQHSTIHVPARISMKKTIEIQQVAKRIYRILGCSGFARVDLFLTPQGNIVFNEVNTIPGFTEHSRYPGMMNAAGYSFSALLDKLIEQVVTT